MKVDSVQQENNMNNVYTTLTNIDCFDKMKTMEDGSVKLIVTDPPYGIGFTGKTSNTEWDDIDDFKSFIIKFLTEAKRILSNDGTLWMCCARTMIPTVFAAIEEVGLHNNLENWLTYARAKGRGASKKLKSQAEEILHITKTKKYEWHTVEYLREVVVPYVKDGKPRGWFMDQTTGMRVRWSGVGNVLAFTSPFFKCKFEKQIHSTQKPILLFTELIMLSSKPGDTVFDPFAGSGASGVAANISGRNWIGCEIDKEMFDKANDWLHNIDYDLAKEYINSRVK